MSITTTDFMPTIYIDCSMTCKLPINTGIQRVVRNVARHATQSKQSLGVDIKLVNIRDGEFSEVSLEQFQPTKIEAIGRRRLGLTVLLTLMTLADRLRYAVANLLPSVAWRDFIYAPYYRFGLAYCVLFPVQPLLRLRAKHKAKSSSRPWNDTTDLSGDILLLADSTWEFDVWPIVSRFKEQGGYVASIVYDLIPISHPHFCVPSLTDVFSRWIKQSVHFVDFYICISRSTETTLKQFLDELQLNIPTSFFHLGSDLDLAQDTGTPRPLVSTIFADEEPVFLTVGSLEPRKNLAFEIDAFDVLWQRDSRVKLVLVGHHTWKVDDLIARIQHHPQTGKRLFWLRDATDTDLEYLYQHATALVFASRIEGFGLPLVEAMQRGLPILCSDIAVFHEIADGKARFFSLENHEELVAAVIDIVHQQTDPETPRRTPFPWLSWQESTNQLLSKILEQHAMDRITMVPDSPTPSLSSPVSLHSS